MHDASLSLPFPFPLAACSQRALEIDPSHPAAAHIRIAANSNVARTVVQATTLHMGNLLSHPSSRPSLLARRTHKRRNDTFPHASSRCGAARGSCVTSLQSVFVSVAVERLCPPNDYGGGLGNVNRAPELDVHEATVGNGNVRTLLCRRA